MTNNIAIIIPARYASKRFAGKPLALLNGREVLAHVVDRAREAAKDFPNIKICVATDDDRIKDFCERINVDVVMTAADLQTGTDRVLAAAKTITPTPDIIVNLQGDAPFTYADMITDCINALIKTPHADIATPVTALSWSALDALRASKTSTPFSGTTVIRNNDGTARWFSKSIIPALKTETKIRGNDSELSPVFRHLGLYVFRFAALQKFAALPPSYYEELEELEQLRALENGMNILTVPVNYNNRPEMTGIDSPEDLARAELILKTMERA